MTKIAFLGTGLMGLPMTLRLLGAGHDVTVWNRTASRADPAVDAGARLASTAADAVQDAEVIISMLADGFATGALQESADLRAALPKGAVWVDMSSAKPEHARAQAQDMATLGLDHLDAPVSGGTKGAEAGTLAIMVGGDADVLARIAPVFEPMGRAVHVGPSGAGQLCKLANQAIVAVTISAVAEATLLAQQGGADPAALRAALAGGFADSVILQQHGTRMSTGDFEPGGLSQLQLKDLDNILAEAQALNLTLPSTIAVRDRFARLVHDLDGAETDHSGLYLELKDINGL